MKTEKRLPKVREVITIPAELLDFLKTNMYQGYMNGEDGALCESDDGIQNEIACAGLIDPELKNFVVSYYPLKDSEYHWDFYITLDDLKEISEGRKNTLTLWKCSAANCQNKADCDDFLCFLHDFADDGTGESKLIRSIHKLSFREMLDMAYGPKKNKPAK